MAKRKNTLKDLDAFLKQEATSLVNPEKISQPGEQQQTSSSEAEATSTTESATPAIKKEDIISELQKLAAREGGDFRNQFYSIIKETLEKFENSTPEDKMLINTILYINDKHNWKENIQNYWQNK